MGTSDGMGFDRSVSSIGRLVGWVIVYLSPSLRVPVSSAGLGCAVLRVRVWVCIPMAQDLRRRSGVDRRWTGGPRERGGKYLQQVPSWEVGKRKGRMVGGAMGKAKSRSGEEMGGIEMCGLGLDWTGLGWTGSGWVGSR